MRHRATEDTETRRFRLRRQWLTASIVLSMAMMLAAPAAHAASLSARELQVIGRIATFLVPPLLPDSRLVICYAPGDAASREDAQAIAAAIGDRLDVGGVKLRPVVADTTALGAGGYRLVIAAAGAASATASAAIRAAHALCVTADLAAVRAGLCTMAIQADPRIEITVNREATMASGIDFAVAFRMMIREI